MPADKNTNLMALGSLAVLGVYSAGWYRTKAAADKFAADDAPRRRPPAPMPAAAVPASGQMVVERVVTKKDRGTVQNRAGAEAAQPTLPAMKVAEPDWMAPAAVPDSTAPKATAAAPVVDSVATPKPEPAPAPPPVVAPAPAVAPAAAHPAPAAAPEPPAKPKLKDGTYYGWGTSRHGDIQAAVTIENGRIVGSMITQCLTRYSCSWIAELPPQVLQRQSAEVDYVSGATQSANAFYYATLEALSHAK